MTRNDHSAARPRSDPLGARIDRSNLLSPAGALEILSRASFGTVWGSKQSLEPESARLRYRARIGHSSLLDPAGPLDHTKLHAQGH